MTRYAYNVKWIIRQFIWKKKNRNSSDGNGRRRVDQKILINEKCVKKKNCANDFETNPQCKKKVNDDAETFNIFIRKNLTIVSNVFSFVYIFFFLFFSVDDDIINLWLSTYINSHKTRKQNKKYLLKKITNFERRCSFHFMRREEIYMYR